jgi:hypothetical protein
VLGEAQGRELDVYLQESIVRNILNSFSSLKVPALHALLFLLCQMWIAVGQGPGIRSVCLI